MVKRAREPITHRIADILRRRIIEGVYPSNTFLPSVRDLARELETSRNTIVSAFALLSDQGLTEQSRGRGTRVLRLFDSKQVKPMLLVYRRYLVYTFWQEAETILAGAVQALSRFSGTMPYEIIGPEATVLAPDEICDKYSGLLLVDGAWDIELALEVEKRHLPMVMANLEIDLDVTATWVDHARATKQAVDLLMAFGHRRIAFMGTDPSLVFYGKARNAYIEALEQAGISPREEYMEPLTGTSALQAYSVAKAALGLAKPPTAFVAARDILAEGIVYAVEEKGLIVGRDVSVVGFDDNSWPLTNRFLTTFREPCEEMGAVAMQMLVERVFSGWRQPEKRELAAPLVVRTSAGPLLLGSPSLLSS